MGGSRSNSEFFLGKSSQNSSKPVLIFWSSIPYVPVFCLYNYTLITVVSYYDLSVLSMSVMGLKKKFVWGWVDGVYPILFWIFGIFLTLQSP